MKKLIEKINTFLLRHTGVPLKERVFLVHQLSIMIKTGISLASALETISKEISNKKLKLVLTDVLEGVKKGNPFSQGLLKHQKIFGELFINMIKSGEESGRLEEVLNQLFIQMKKDHTIISKVRGALIYPVIVITAMIGVGIAMIVYVVPSLIGVFDEVSLELPLATRILIWISDLFQNYGLYLATGAIIAAAIFVRLITLPRGKKIFHIIILRTPIISRIVKKINLARFCRTVSSLLKTDISLIETFEITSKILGNQLYKDALKGAKETIKKGQRIEEALRPYDRLFPPIVLQMIAIGEETGSVDTILEQSAQFYEDDVDQIMTNLPSILDPILILFLGGGVAVMAMAIIMPIYSLSEGI